MASKPRLLDLFCGAGGCAMGYHRAGFDVWGVDHKPQPHYPFEFIHADAIMYLRNLIDTERGGVIDSESANACGTLLSGFDVIHASPPCQVYSAAARIGNARPGHQDLVATTRKLLQAAGKPYVIENVPGAPLHFPVVLCGTQFGLNLRRHRLFESNILLLAPSLSCKHQDGDITVFGHAVQACGSKGPAYKDSQGRTHWRQKRLRLESGCVAMGIDWMTRAELSQAIPPAYTEFIGKQLMRVVTENN